MARGRSRSPIGWAGRVGAGPGGIDAVDRLLDLGRREPPVSRKAVAPSDQSDVVVLLPSLCRLASNALDAGGNRILGRVVDVDQDPAGDHLDLRPGRGSELAALIEGSEQGRQRPVQPARSRQPRARRMTLGADR